MMIMKQPMLYRIKEVALHPELSPLFSLSESLKLSEEFLLLESEYPCNSKDDARDLLAKFFKKDQECKNLVIVLYYGQGRNFLGQRWTEDGYEIITLESPPPSSDLPAIETTWNRLTSSNNPAAAAVDQILVEFNLHSPDHIFHSSSSTKPSKLKCSWKQSSYHWSTLLTKDASNGVPPPSCHSVLNFQSMNDLELSGKGGKFPYHLQQSVSLLSRLHEGSFENNGVVSSTSKEGWLSDLQQLLGNNNKDSFNESDSSSDKAAMDVTMNDIELLSLPAFSYERSDLDITEKIWYYLVQALKFKNILSQENILSEVLKHLFAAYNLESSTGGCMPCVHSSNATALGLHLKTGAKLLQEMRYGRSNDDDSSSSSITAEAWNAKCRTLEANAVELLIEVGYWTLEQDWKYWLEAQGLVSPPDISTGLLASNCKTLPVVKALTKLIVLAQCYFLPLPVIRKVVYDATSSFQGEGNALLEFQAVLKSAIPERLRSLLLDPTFWQMTQDESDTKSDSKNIVLRAFPESQKEESTYQTYVATKRQVVLHP